MATQGLALVTYLEQMEKNAPYTQNWFYQPMGWLWTEANTFPFIYRAPDGEEQGGGWLYFSQLMNSQVHLSTTTPARLGSRPDFEEIGIV